MYIVRPDRPRLWVLFWFCYDDPSHVDEEKIENKAGIEQKVIRNIFQEKKNE